MRRYVIAHAIKPISTKIILTASAVVLVLTTTIAPFAHADTYDQQIAELRNQNAGTQEARNDLAVQAQDLKATIAGLQAEIGAIEAQLQANREQQAAIQAEIAAAEAQLADERAVLGINIKQMYVDNEMSTIEMLASSQDISEFLDRDQYRSSVQDKITQTMAKIEELKKQLSERKAAVDKLIADQEAMRGTLAAKRAETNRLLSLNEAQQAEFNGAIAANNRKISDLQRQQALENARFNVGSVSYSGSGGYPWANVPSPNSMPDPWGMYKRQCVSYTAWKVASTGRHMPYWGGRGNAKLWDDNARAAGIPVDYTPRAGSVAVSNSGTYGHVMYVEQVHDDGTITISRYNASWDGRYSVVRRSASGLSFVHFQ